MEIETKIHEYYMQLALDEAKKGKSMTKLNPMVGAIIVKDNQIISRGYHKKYKGDHAEVDAIKNSKVNLENSTMYVTLEPCSHYGNTPPCVDKIIENKISKVVIASLDPNPIVDGNGVKKLVENNIEVITGILDDENQKLNEVFMKYIKTREPFIIMKSAMSLDGKICTNIGESKWISCEKSREHTHNLRGDVSAIMVGINTVIKDNPKLTCRVENKDNPIKIIVDSNLKIPMDSYIVEDAKNNKTIIVTTNNSDNQKIKLLEELNIEIMIVNKKDSRVDLKDMVKKLGQSNINSILLEGGSTLNFSALKEGIVDKVMFYIAPKIIGGSGKNSCVSGDGIKKLDDCIDIDNLTYTQIDKDILIQGYTNKRR